MAVLPRQVQLGDIDGAADQFPPGGGGGELHPLVGDVRHGRFNLEAVHPERPFPALPHSHGAVHFQFRVSLDFQRRRQLHVFRSNGPGHVQHRMHGQRAVHVYLDLSVHAHHLAGKNAAGVPYVQIRHIKIAVLIAEIAGGPLELFPQHGESSHGTGAHDVQMLHALPVLRENRTARHLYVRLAQELHLPRHQGFINNGYGPGHQGGRAADIPDQGTFLQIGLEGKIDEAGRFRIPHGKALGHDDGIRVIPAEQEIPDPDFPVPQGRSLQIHAHAHSPFRVVAQIDGQAGRRRLRPLHPVQVFKHLVQLLPGGGHVFSRQRKISGIPLPDGKRPLGSHADTLHHGISLHDVHHAGTPQVQLRIQPCGGKNSFRLFRVHGKIDVQPFHVQPFRHYLPVYQLLPVQGHVRLMQQGHGAARLRRNTRIQQLHVLQGHHGAGPQGNLQRLYVDGNAFFHQSLFHTLHDKGGSAPDGDITDAPKHQGAQQNNHRRNQSLDPSHECPMSHTPCLVCTGTATRYLKIRDIAPSICVADLFYGNGHAVMRLEQPRGPSGQTIYRRESAFHTNPINHEHHH